DILEITNITSGLPEFVPGYTTLTLAPGDSSFLTVSFNPVTVDTFISNLTLVTNIGNHNICLNGVSTYPPIISIDPATIDTTVSACNDTVLLPVIIYNTGNHPLVYTAGNIPGITYTNSADTIPSNDSTIMLIHFNAVTSGQGTHNYSIQIASNDPLHPITVLDLGIIVNPIPSKPVAPDASICFDQPTPALSALGTAIRWYSNGELTNLLYTGNPFTPGDTAVGVYHYYATQTIDGCEGPADTATFTVFAIPLPPVSNNVTVCFGNTNTLLIAAGWNILWYDDGGLTNLVHSGNSYNTGISSVGIYPYYITQTQNGCISLSDTVTLSINPVPAPPLVHDTTVCFGNPVPVLVAGGINIQWYSDSLLMNLIIANDTLITGQTAAGIYNYYATQTDTVYSCESEPVRNTLTIFLPPRPVTSDEAVCFGFTTPDLSASGINIQWYDDGALSNLVHTGNIFPTGQTVAGTYTYYATQTDTVFGCESLSDTAVLYIYPIPPFPVASDTTICFDNITPDLAAVGNNIIWYDDTLLTNVVHSGNIYHTGITAVGTYPFFVTQTVNNCESPADTVVLTINPIPAPPLVSDTAICSGMATPDLVAIGVNINWYSDSTLTNLIYSGDTLTPADTLQGVYHYWVTQTNAGYNCEGHPAMITLTIDSLLPPPTALSQSICFGESTPDLTATGDSIRWYSDAVLTVLVHSGNIFNSGDTAVGDHIYYITQNSQCGESTADSVTLTIYPIPAAPATTDESVCFGSSVPVLTAAGANLIWYSDTAMTNVVSNDTIYDTGETAVGIYNYFITQTINGCVSPADTATLEIKPIPATPVSSDTAICFGTATPDLNATGNNVLWYSDISLTNLVNTGNTFATGETAVGVYKYYIIDYDSLVSCPSFTDSVILTINPIPAAPAASDETICFEQPTPDLVATGTNIIWYNDSLQSNIVNTGNVFTTGESAVDTFVYFATQTVSNCESPADMVVLTINPIPAPPLVSDTSICSSMTTPDLIAIGDNINWYSDSALTNLIYNGDTFSPGVSLQGIYHYWVTQTNAGYNCEGHPSMVTLTIDSLLPPPVAIGQAICFGESAPDLTATGDSIRWYSDAALTTLVHSGNIFNSGDTAVGNHVYYFTQNNHCGESTADSVTLTIYPIPATPATTDESICFGSTVPVLTATGTNLIWYSDTAMTNVVSNDTIYDTGETAVGIYNYFVTQTINGCVSPAAGISLTIHALPPLPASSDVAVCVTATIPDLVATGINITWYDSTFTTPIHLGDTLVTGQTAVGTYVYYVTQTDTITNCTSPADTVTLEIDSPLSAPLGEDKTLCLGSGLPDVTATGINMQWYDDTLLTNLVFSGDTFPTGITVPGTYYYYVTQNNACGESTADTVTLTIHDIPPTPVTSDNSVCYGNTIPSFTASGNIIRWYSDSTLTTLVSIGNDFLPPDTLPGIYTYYVADADTTTGCLSIPNSATLTIKNVPPAPLTSDTAICYGLNVTDLTASGINIHWYSDSLLVNLVDSGNTLATGQTTAGIYTYYAAQTNECGEGTASSATLTINALPSTPVVNNEAICDGAPAPVFSATGNNIIWYSDSALTINIGSGNTYTPTDTIVGYYTYYFTQTDINTGCISNAGMVTYTVNIMPLPPATTGATACSDQPASLMAIGTNITWYSDSLLTSPLDTGNIYIPADTAVGLHTYYATQSPTGCESSYETTVLTILATPSAPVVSGATICSGEIIPVLAASGSNILWYSDSLLTDSVGSGNNYTPQDSLAGTYNYYVTQTANTCESNYADALFTVHSTPLPPAILDTSVCFGTPNPVLTATGNYVIWYADSLLTTALDTGNVYTPILTTVGIYTYYLTQTDTITGCTSQSSDVLFAINTIPIPPVTLDTSICSGGINPALTATGTNIIWYSDLLLMNEVGTGASYISPQTTPGIYTYYVTQTMSNCESNYETAVLTILASPAAPVVSDTSICTGETIPAMSASGTNITWYSDSLLTDVIGTGNNYTPQDSAVGVYIYYVTQSNGICESNYSEAQFTINVSTTPPSAPDKSACFGALNPLFTATGNNITWYSDSLLTQVVHTGNTFTPDDSTAGVHHYYITQTNVTCGESTAEEVLFTIMALPAPPAANDVTICFGSTTPDLTASGINIKWYSEEELIILVNTGNTFTTGYTDVGYYTLYATQTVGGCTSPANDVILTINPTPLVTLSQYQVYIHKGESVTLTAYNANSYIWTPAAGLNTTTGPVVIATPMTTTTYTVIGTSSQGCVDTASCVIDVWQIGVEETPFAKSLLVYPNPSNGVLMIEYHTSGREILTVNLYNQINQCIFTKKLTVENGDMKEALNILNLAEGVYNLQIIKDKDIVNKKIVLRH
ncbi:MAG: T9SS type A sorting domain-containing protein, partial [Bacteroidia bacterium]|nr:T9SS type A sorting domain-containing protein [Bacteroidia bacterium]